MKKNIVKAMLKVMATATVAATMFIGGNMMTAKAAEEWDPWCEMNGITQDEFIDLMMEPEYADEFFTWLYAQYGMDWEESCEIAVNELKAMGFFDNMPTINDITTARKDMLKLVNADRKANGAGNLTWNADLEAAARQRAIEVMNNAQTAEFEEARKSYAAGMLCDRFCPVTWNPGNNPENKDGEDEFGNATTPCESKGSPYYNYEYDHISYRKI